MSKLQYENAEFYQVRYTEDGEAHHYDQVSDIEKWLEKRKTDDKWIIEKVTVNVERVGSGKLK